MERSALETFRLDKMVKGWFVGDFSPAALRTEVAVKYYKAGEREEAHLHKIVFEVALVLEGIVNMCGQRLSKGDIIKLAPSEATDFLAVTDATAVVIKLPSVIGENPHN